MSEPGLLSEDPVSGLPVAHGGPPLSGVLKAQPEDFLVEEELGFPLRGEGEHLVLRVRKRGLNTLEVAQRIAAWAGVRPLAVGFAGLKDRRAVTVQHFSVQIPGAGSPDVQSLAADGLEVLDLARHHRKLQRGGLQGNRFVLRLTDVVGGQVAAERRLEDIRTQGVPNYFGMQRFGRHASNLTGAQSLFSGRASQFKPEQRRMYVSAARSHIFNRVLAARVHDGSWNGILPGEVVLLGPDRRQLIATAPSEVLLARLAAGELDPSGPLPGRAGHCLSPEKDAARTEADVIQREQLQPWVDSLVRLEVDGDRRALRMRPAGLAWEWENDATLVLRFGLAAGSYATSLVRELMVAQPPNLRDSST